MAEQILSTEYSEEMQKSYLDYSMSVITSRAVPDIRDGLKPVQRRVLFDMGELRVFHDRPTLKSARICGDTMGKYHPHGDSSIYETLVVMAQDFKRMQALIEGQGNFGSIEGDSAAAPRYTEARLEAFTEKAMLEDLSLSVPFQPNYDGKLMEPEVLPAKIPYFLLNGSEGIAVGMTTSTPSHNLTELINLILAYMKNPEMSLEEMLRIMPGPDFPTGGMVANKDDLAEIYATGQGKLRLRGKLVFEKKQGKNDRDKLVITEIPYTMVGAGISKFMQDVAGLCDDKKITDSTDISNQSGEQGIRIVLELKSNADMEKIENILYKKTKLEDSFPVNMLAIAKGRPETLSLKRVLEEYLSFQEERIHSKFGKLLEKEEKKKEIEEGLIKAVDVIDAIIALLRGAKSQKEAKIALMQGDSSVLQLKDRDLIFLKDIESFSFTEVQAQAILDMRLSKLIGLEILSLQKSYRETLKNIKSYKAIVSSKEVLYKHLEEELLAIREEFGRKRRTEIRNAEEAVYDENAIEEMDLFFVQDRFGYGKLLEPQVYQRNKESIEADYPFVLSCKNTDRLLFFTSEGNLHQVKVLDYPLAKFKDKGIPLDNLCKFSSDKEVVLSVFAKTELLHETLLFLSRNGYGKRVEGSEFDTQNRLVQATKLVDDSLVAVLPVKAEEQLVLESEESFFLRFPVEELPVQKKTARGVCAMSLKKGDGIKSVYLLSEQTELKLSGKNLSLSRLKLAKRGGKGAKHS